MNLLKEGKTNWKYILIVLILAVVVGGGILGWIKMQEVPPVELPEIKKPKKVVEEEIEEIVEDETAVFVKSWREVPIDISACSPRQYEEFEPQRTTIDSKNNIFISPRGGEVYKLGSKITIQWDPNQIDMSTISIYPVDNDYNNCLHIYGLGSIYMRESLDDPVSREGVFTYQLSGLYPAEYHVVLSNWGRFRNIMSNPIEIQPVQTFRVPVVGGFTMNLTKLPPSNFSMNDYFSVTIKAQDATTRSITSDDGFVMIGQIYEQDSNRYMKGFDGYYSPQDDLWFINGQLNLPKGNYQIRISLWCAYTRMICGQRFAPADQQQDLTLYFTVE